MDEHGNLSADQKSGSREATTTRTTRLIGGWVLIALGLWLLVAQYVHVDWNLVWPLIVMGAGVLLIVAARRRRTG